jgi:mono/diheme cytochrome c family protein
MRTNPAAFALSLGMGLIVLLIGFLALNVGGLVNVAPADEVVAERASTGEDDVIRPTGDRILPAAYVPATPEEASAIAEGDALFKNNCGQCHAVNDKVVGPALAGISKRRSIGWLIPWVKNSSKVIATGDEYAVKLFEDNGKQQMPAFPQLSDKQITSIIAWVNAGTDGPPAPATSTVAVN